MKIIYLRHNLRYLNLNFETSHLASIYQHHKLTLDFGLFYFCDHFVIGEINEGIDYNWEKVETLAMMIVEHYGNNPKLGYISNRVNSYSVNPKLWDKFHNTYYFIVANAIVSYNKFGSLNANLEKMLTKQSTKRCSSLEEAIEWITNLKEFKS